MSCSAAAFDDGRLAVVSKFEREPLAHLFERLVVAALRDRELEQFGELVFEVG
jgi:hypothetical protein